MPKILLQLSAISVTAVFLTTAVDSSWLFFFQEELHPTTIEDLAKKTDANRRTRSAEEDAREEYRREEEDDEGSDLLSGLNWANPFLPRRQLPQVPAIDIPIPLPHTDLPPAGSPSAKKVATKKIKTTDAEYAQRFDQRKIKSKAFSADTASVATTDLTHCKAIVERTLSIVPNELTANLDQLTLHFSKRQARGLSNSHIIELQCGGLSDREVVAVLVHELGHIADLGAFRGVSTVSSAFLDGKQEIPTDDLSIQFYEISWRDSNTKKFTTQRQDFVSGYAATDPFEDFAESFITYILHGNDFRVLAKESSALQAKYDFLRNQVFSGAEYETKRNMQDKKRVWDVTLVEYGLADFWVGETDQIVTAIR